MSRKPPVEGTRLICRELAGPEPTSTPSSSTDSGIVLAVIAILVILIYMFPTINANGRHHRNTAAITVLNVFLGWTFVGWVVALVWSYTDYTTDNFGVPSATTK